MKKQLQILSTPAFIIGLILLLLNDWMLKDLFHNWATGKLSDFAGMFVFPLFWMALFPKLGKHAFWASAVWFIYWKSPYSQPLIEGWNSVGLYSINRVVDLTDLMALVMVPLAYRYWKHEPKAVPFRLHPVVPLGVAAFAFMATSYHESFTPKDTYLLPYPKDTLYSRLQNLDSITIIESSFDTLQNPDTIELNMHLSKELELEVRDFGIKAIASQLSNGQTLFTVWEINYQWKKSEETENTALTELQEILVNPLLEKHRATQDSLRNIP